jgi:hypothetical protein
MVASREILQDFKNSFVPLSKISMASPQNRDKFHIGPNAQLKGICLAPNRNLETSASHLTATRTVIGHPIVEGLYKINSKFLSQAPPYVLPV